MLDDRDAGLGFRQSQKAELENGAISIRCSTNPRTAKVRSNVPAAAVSGVAFGDEMA
jgi:hypothetical protein